jgi:hypothetical protein
MVHYCCPLYLDVAIMCFLKDLNLKPLKGHCGPEGWVLVGLPHFTWSRRKIRLRNVMIFELLTFLWLFKETNIWWSLSNDLLPWDLSLKTCMCSRVPNLCRVFRPWCVLDMIGLWNIAIQIAIVLTQFCITCYSVICLSSMLAYQPYRDERIWCRSLYELRIHPPVTVLPLCCYRHIIRI